MLKSFNDKDTTRHNAVKAMAAILDDNVVDSSIFDRAWRHTAGGENELFLAKIYDLLGMIETHTTSSQKYLTNDLFIGSKVSSVVSQLEREYNESASDILISKSEMINLVTQILQHIKIVDYTALKVYGNFDDKYRYYEDNYHNLIIKRSNISILNSSLSDPEDASDEGDVSIMDNFYYHRCSSSPTSFLESEPTDFGFPRIVNERSSPQVIEKELCIGEVLKELKEFHDQLHYRFESFEYQINSLKNQNKNDLTNLQAITYNNNAIISRVRTIQNDLNILNQEFKALKDDAIIPIDNEHKINNSGNKIQNLTENINLSIHPTSTTATKTDNQLDSSELFFYSVVFLSFAVVYKIMLSYF